MSINVTPGRGPGKLPVYTWQEPTSRQEVPGYLTWEHARIHDGYSYDASFLKGKLNELADGADLNILIQAVTGMHFIFEVACGGNAEIYFFNEPTWSDQGTTITAFNKNDYSTNTTTNIITHTPTLDTDGTQRMSKLLPGGNKTAGSGGSDGSYSREIDLKAGNNYMIRVTNISGAIQPTSVAVEWYEL